MAELVEQWTPGVSVVESDGAIAVEVAKVVDHVLAIECASIDEPWVALAL